MNWTVRKSGFAGFMILLLLSLAIYAGKVPDKSRNKSVNSPEYTFSEYSYDLHVNKNIKYARHFYFNKGAKEFLLFGCTYNKFYLMDLDTKITDTIYPAGADPSDLFSFSVVNEDSIFIIDNTISRIIYLMNINGNIYKTLDFQAIDRLVKYPPFLLSSSCNPVINYKGITYFTGYSGGEFEDERKDNRPVLLCYNNENSGITLKINYPEIYQKYNWAGLDFRDVYNTYNPKKHWIIFSFPASQKIFVYELENGEYRSYEAGSKYFGNIHPFQKDKKWFGALAKKDYISYYYKNPSYFEIYYDKYRNLYYRIAEFPNKQFSYPDLNSYEKKKSVIILDQDFNYVGEKMIKETFFHRSIFIDREGINIIMPMMSTPDSIMRIKVLTPVKLKHQT